MKLIRRLFLFLSAGLFAMSLHGYLGSEKAPARDTESQSAVSAPSEGYLVRSDGDRIRIQPISGGRPGYVEGLRVSDLPEEDRLQLAQGFSLPDEASLLALLEDYTG